MKKGRSSSLFKSTIKIEKNEFRSKKVIDIGCGNGRFSTIVSKLGTELLFLIDLSDGIDKAYTDAKMSNKNVIAIQCDILEMPIKKEFFDIAYSWGVLHHTGNTRLAFKNAASLTKTDGILGVYLYENKPKYDYKNIFMRLLGIIRQILIILPLRYFAQLLSPIMVVRFFTPIFYFEKLINFGIVGCTQVEIVGVKNLLKTNI